MADNVLSGEAIPLAAGAPVRLDAVQAPGRKWMSISNNADSATAYVYVQMAIDAPPASPVPRGQAIQIPAGETKWFPHASVAYAYYASSDTDTATGAALWIYQYGE